MAFSSKHLTQGESIELEFRTHIKRIIGPILVILAMIVLGVLAYFYLPDSGQPWTLIAVLVLCLIVLFIWGLIPIWKWRNTVFVLTNRRLITRTGIMAKAGRDIPLFRINDVQYEKGVSDRVLGCGTLLISDASDQPQLRLEDIPHVESVQVKINELLFSHSDSLDEGGHPRGASRERFVAPRDEHGRDERGRDERGRDERPFDQQRYDDRPRYDDYNDSTGSDDRPQPYADGTGGRAPGYDGGETRAMPQLPPEDGNPNRY